MNIDLPLAMAGVIAVASALGCWAGVELCAAALGRYRRTFTDRAGFSLREMFLFIDPGKLYVLNIAGVMLVGAVAAMLSRSLPLAAVAAVAAGFVPWLILRLLRARRLQKLEEQLPDALMVLAGGLRAGVSLSVAIAQLVREAQPPLAQEFDLLQREQRLGVALDEALENLNRRVPTQSMTLVVSAMRIASSTGGGLAETLERAAHTVRSRLAMEGKIRALTAQGKLQAIVVGLLPFALLFVLTKMEPEAMAQLWTTRIGHASLVVIVILEFFGIMLIRKIVAIDV